MTISRTTRLATVIAGAFLALSMVAVDHAEARRGGSFGSRGSRTFQSAPPTRTAPQPAAPVERSMTPNPGPGATQNSAARPGPAAAQQRPGFMNGFGGTLLKGLAIGGLIGLLMGNGLGGLAGFFGLLMQVLLIGGAVFLVMRLLRARREPEPALAGAGAGGGSASFRDAQPRDASAGRGFSIPTVGSQAASQPPAPVERDLELGQADLDAFERLLTEVQEAFGREDHGALRRLVTPEMVSYLSEELADNAQNGQRNDVSQVKLHQADIAEAWSEGARDYATAALGYSSIDVMRDRATGDVVAGNPDQPSEATELWTFVRDNGGDWKLSAFQPA